MSTPVAPDLEPSEAAVSKSASIVTSSVNSPGNMNDSFAWGRVSSLRFLFQVLLTFSVLIFCIYQITNENNQEDAAYWGGITGLIAWWMPTPGDSSNSKEIE